jgi:hypothetical protein
MVVHLFRLSRLGSICGWIESFVQPSVEVANNYSKKEKPWRVKQYADEKVMQDITLPKKTLGN